MKMPASCGSSTSGVERGRDLAITLGLVPQRPELSRRYDAVTDRRLLPLANGADRVLVEPAPLHSEIEMPFTIVRW